MSREQLKNVLGGFTGGTGGTGTDEGTTAPGETKCDCSNNSDCPTAEGQKPQGCNNTGCTPVGAKAGTCGWDGTA